MFLFWASQFGARNITRRPSKHCFRYVMNLVRWVYVGFLRWHNSHKPSNHKAESLFRYPKKTLLQHFRLSCSDPKVLFSGEKSCKIARDCFVFWQWPKITSTNTRAIKNTKNWCFYLWSQNFIISSKRLQAALVSIRRVAVKHNAVYTVHTK